MVTSTPQVQNDMPSYFGSLAQPRSPATTTTTASLLLELSADLEIMPSSSGLPAQPRPQAQATTNTMSRSFLDLPAELRIMSYDYYVAAVQESLDKINSPFDREAPCNLWHHFAGGLYRHCERLGHHTDRCRTKQRRSLVQQSLALLSVCGEFQAEIEPRLYKIFAPIFTEYTQSTLYAFSLEQVKAMANIVDRNNLSHPRHIELRVLNHNRETDLGDVFKKPMGKLLLTMQLVGILEFKHTQEILMLGCDEFHYSVTSGDDEIALRGIVPEWGYSSFTVSGPLTKVNWVEVGGEEGKWEVRRK